MRFIMVFALAWAAVCFSAQAETRLALVVANSEYNAKIGRLSNPINDAGLMKEALSEVGFEVTVATDLNQAQLKRAIRDHRDRIEAAGQDVVSFFYYSGHGAADAEAAGNYLVPLAADIRRPRDLPIEGLPVSQIVQSFGESKQNFVVIDACRNFPFEFADSRSVRKGFVPQPEKRGTLIAFATSPGTVASDEGDGGGPYARALASLIKTPGSDHIDVFKGVQDIVDQETNGFQFPWYRDGVRGRFRFSTSSAAPAAAPTPVATTTVPAARPPTEMTFMDARKTLASTPAPIITGDPAVLPDFALFKQCEDCPEMVVLPGGAFKMGSLLASDCCQEMSGPKVDAQVGRFAVSRFETTYSEWKACTDAGYCSPVGEWTKSYDLDDRPVLFEYGDGLANLTEDNRPIEPEKFLAYASQKAGTPYRLLSEAEWVYAALGGASTKFYWGDQDPSCNYGAFNGANNCDPGNDLGALSERPVGSYRPNPFGLFDMFGNAWEVVDACSADDPYTRIARECGGVAARGGGSFNGPWENSANENYIRHDNWLSGMGMRVAKSL